jgi:hypothetical protein
LLQKPASSSQTHPEIRPNRPMRDVVLVKNAQFLTRVPSKGMSLLTKQVSLVAKCGGHEYPVVVRNWCFAGCGSRRHKEHSHFGRRNTSHSTSPSVVHLENSVRKVASVRNVMQPMPQDLAVLSFDISVSRISTTSIVTSKALLRRS